MHVVQIIGDGRPGGGTTNVLALTADILRRRDLRVTFVTESGSFAAGEARRLGAAAVEIEFMQSRINLRAWSRLRSLLAETGPDIVHVHGARAALPLSFAMPRQRRYAALYTLRGAHFAGKRWPLRSLAMMAERRCHAAVDVSIFVSEHDRSLAERHGLLTPAARRLVIGNGIDLAMFPAPRAPDLGLVTFLGRLSHEKQPDIVLHLARLLKNEGFRFQLIGEGPEEAALRRMAREFEVEDAVAFCGYLGHRAAFERLNGSLALLLPSKWEGFPRAPIEAMALDVPTVAARVGGVPEVVEHDVTGLTVPAGDIEAYAEALRALAKDAALRSRLVAAGRTRAWERFSQASVTAAHLDLYQDLMARRGPSERGADASTRARASA